MKKLWIYDIEQFQNFHCCTFVDTKKEEKRVFVLHQSRNDIEAYIKFLETEVSGLVGFNNLAYDYPMLHHILKNKSNYLRIPVDFILHDLYLHGKQLIEEEGRGGIPTKQIKIPQMDLYLMYHFDNKNKRTSLKYLEINTRFHNVQDIPFEANHWVEVGDIPLILEYNENDCNATLHFYNIAHEEIEARKNFMTQFGFGIEFMNYNDPKIGSEIFAKAIAEEMQIPMSELKQMRTERPVMNLNDIILPVVKFRTKQFNDLLRKFKSTIITSTLKPFEYSCIYKGFKYDYGVGGIHGCIEPGIYEEDDKYMILDIDVTSMYPWTAIWYKLYPQHLGMTFVKVLQDLFDMRTAAKRKNKLDPTDKASEAINGGLKLAMNGCVGKANDKYSYMYDPQFNMSITVNGQLLLSMLAERINDIEGLIMLQANTDGITVKIRRDKEDEFRKICKEWEEEVGYQLEYAQYKKMVIRDVNNYLAQDMNGKPKHKGIFEIIPKQNGKIAYNKNWSERIIPIALEAYYLRGIPVEETIRNHKDIFDFCIAKKFPKPWYGRWEYIENGEKRTIYFKKNIRYYVSNKGSFLYKVEDHPDPNQRRESQLSVGYSVTPFNLFVQKDNYDINYGYYISETKKIINSINDGQLKMPWF